MQMDYESLRRYRSICTRTCGFRTSVHYPKYCCPYNAHILYRYIYLHTYYLPYPYLFAVHVFTYLSALALSQNSTLYTSGTLNLKFDIISDMQSVKFAKYSKLAVYETGNENSMNTKPVNVQEM